MRDARYRGKMCMSSTSLNRESACYAEASCVRERETAAKRKAPPDVSPCTPAASVVAYFLTFKNDVT